jgi:hypothetical protein
MPPAPSPATAGPAVAGLEFAAPGYTEYGEWSCNVSATPSTWKPGDSVKVTARLRVTMDHMGGLSALGLLPEGLCALMTAERTFDADGVLRLPSDERMSTILTPSGLAIEGGVQGAVTDRFGAYSFRTPVDEFQTVRFSQMAKTEGYRETTFSLAARLPDDLPPGIYRLRIDFGVLSAKRYYSLNGETFAYRPFFKGRPTESHIYSPPIRASGRHASGRGIDAASIKPRIPWVILANYNSNGSRGAVADEDKDRFALSNRNIIPDDTVLPLYDDRGNRLSYTLEPQFPADTIELRSNIPWDYTRGEMSVQVTGPDGRTADLGTGPFVGQSGQWPTTRRPTFVSWKPPAYGFYTVKVTGWTQDIWGNRYDGGGTYHFWIAKRMTLATATFQGMSYPVGTKYGRDLGFAPAVPADVDVDVRLYVNSDKNNVRTLSYSGKASPSGIFGTAQGAVLFALDAPGEYYARILARYTDADGNLWVCSLKHAGIVYPEDSPIVARGKKLSVGGKTVDRGETNSEGYVGSDNVSHLMHINFPFLAGDVLQIASEGLGTNKIEPVLTYENKNNPAPYDPRLQTIGATNLRFHTSNRYSPHLFPEYMTSMGYYYAGAPRPGFMSRFLIAEDGTRAPYWPTSMTNFGGQIGASNNGDMPGVIYRFVGGAVLKNQGQAPAYAGYLASGFILPAGSNNNRVTAPGSDVLLSSTGEKGRFFLVGTRIGMTYETGTAFTPVVQVDPILPAVVTFNIRYPDGRSFSTQGTADGFGTAAGKDRWVLDIPGVYRLSIEGDCQGSKGYMPGLPRTGGEFYVIEKDRPADLWGPRLNIRPQSNFDAAKGFSISGNSTADTVYYAAVIPGAVVLQGSVPVLNGRFQYDFDPVAVARAAPAYDIVNRVSGRSEIGAAVHLTFFSLEKASDGKKYHTFSRVIIRGTSVIYVR